jgi:hypothetical protein
LLLAFGGFPESRPLARPAFSFLLQAQAIDPSFSGAF